MCLWGYFRDIRIWTPGFIKVNCCPQCVWASSHSLRDRIEQNDGGRKNSLLFASCLPAWAGTLFFPCPWTGTLNHQLPGFSGLWTWTEIIPAGLPGAPAYRWQTVGLFSVYNLTGLFLITNLFILGLFLWGTMMKTLGWVLNNEQRFQWFTFL